MGVSDGSPTSPLHKKRRESLVMRDKGNAHGLFAIRGAVSKRVLRFKKVEWPKSKISLDEVMADAGHSVKVDIEGKIVCGLLTLLKFKALHPTENSMEVIVVGDDELPSFNEIEVAA